MLFQGNNAKQIEGDTLSKVQKTQMYVHSEEGYINSSFKLSNMHTNDKHIEATIMTLKFKFNAKSLNLQSNRTKILYERPRLLGTRQVFIRTDIRADTACRLYGTTLSEQVFHHLSAEIFDLLRKRTSAGQAVSFRYRVNAHPNKYLHSFVPVSSFAVFMNNFDSSL